MNFGGFLMRFLEVLRCWEAISFKVENVVPILRENDGNLCGPGDQFWRKTTFKQDQEHSTTKDETSMTFYFVWVYAEKD